MTPAQIAATRHRTEADMAMYRSARHWQRRIRAALRTTRFPKSRMERLGRMLQRHRATGFPRDLETWWAEYAEAVRGELRSCLRYRGDAA